jgi:hypothetical protein
MMFRAAQSPADKHHRQDRLPAEIGSEGLLEMHCATPISASGAPIEGDVTFVTSPA